MSSYINTNLNSLVAQNNLSTSQSSLATAMQRLSSGLRINSAADDAAGYAISQRMTAQINGADQAGRNANDGISLAQTAQGALSQITANLQTMRTLAVQSANGTNSASDRAALNSEFQALSSEIQRVAQSASFNGVNLLDGTFNSQNFQVGANAGGTNTITVASISSAQTSALGGSAATAATTYTGGSATSAALTAGAVTLNGIQVGASAAGASAGQTADSAYAIAAAINAVSAQSGVSATAAATTVTGAPASTSLAMTAANSFNINGVNVGAIAAGGNAAGQGANVAAAINSVSAQSGVTATADNTGRVTLTAADGRDISLVAQGTTSAATALANTGLTTGDVVASVAAVVTTAKVTLNSTAANIVVSGGAVGSAGFTAGSYAASTTLAYQTVANADVLTASDATQALSTIDGALATVNSSAAALGAVQNRFSSVVAGLATTGQNLTAARSQIQDANFASETASLSRAQILQQAGTAMIAQANQQPQGVLALLK